MVEWFVPPGETRPEAVYTLRLLLGIAGIPNRETSERSSAVLLYDPDGQPPGASGALRIAPGPPGRWQEPRLGDFVEPEGSSHEAWSSGTGGTDLLQRAFTLVTGQLEGEPRDVVGVPSLREGALAKARLGHTPLVIRLAEALASALERHHDRAIERVPRWPGGARSIIVLSHDVDVPYTRPKRGQTLAWIYRALLSRRMDAISIATLSTLKTAVLWGLGRIPPKATDPNLRFEEWVEVARRFGTTGTFYVPVTSVVDPWSAPEDVKFDFRDRPVADGIRAILNAGAELGLHASINARTSEWLFASEKDRLEHEFGVKVDSIRHHYWAVDPLFPERTLRAHERAGFKVDSSLGINDAPGFRRGTCLPFLPFDRETRRPLEIWEVPPTLMDGGIFYRPVTREQGASEIREHLAQVHAAGGAAVLNWHPEQLNASRLRGAGPALLDVLADLIGDSSVGWMNIGEVVKWWKDRETRVTLP
ncbi:MAG: hypothetical protein ABIQ41_02155 [Gemmatimonadales bacterium]